MLAIFRGVDLMFGWAVAIVLAIPIVLIAGLACLRALWTRRGLRGADELNSTIRELPPKRRSWVEAFRRNMSIAGAVAAVVCLGSLLLYIFVPYRLPIMGRFIWNFGEVIVWSAAIVTYAAVLLRAAGTRVLIRGSDLTFVVSWGPPVVFALLAVGSCIVSLISSLAQGSMQEEFVFGAIYVALAGAGLGILLRLAAASIRPDSRNMLSTSAASILFLLCVLELTVLGWLLWRQM